MKAAVLRTAVLALALWHTCAPAADKPGVVIDLGQVRVNLVSTLDGSSLPVTWPQTWNGASWTLGTEVRSGERIDEHRGYQPNADYVHDLPTRIGASLDNSAAVASMAQLFGDVHLATELGPFPEVHTAAANAGWTARFYLPAYSALTMSGHVSIRTVGEPENAYANFSSAFHSSAYSLPSQVFALERVNQADQDFSITATNPYDHAISWYQETELYVFSVALASPIPEPPPPAMLAAGLLVGWRLWRRRRIEGLHARLA